MSFIHLFPFPLPDKSPPEQPGASVFTGYGGISLAVEGPSKVDIQTEDLEDGTCKVSYFPTVPGVYIVSTKFADEHVPGKVSPLPLLREAWRLL